MRKILNAHQRNVPAKPTKPDIKLEDGVYHKNAAGWALNTDTANLLKILGFRTLFL